jgi:hypothetical protein
LQGTLDSTNYVCAEAAVDFYRSLGGREAIAGYVEPLLDWAQAMLAAALGTYRMPVPKTMEAPFMKVIGKQEASVFHLTAHRRTSCSLRSPPSFSPIETNCARSSTPTV